MKTKVLLIALTVLVMCSAVFGIVSYNRTESVNAAAENEKSCPITPDCQPGDAHCVCPVGCDE